MPARVAMGEMSWVEYSGRITVPGTISSVPVGATEQHGAHMTTDTHIIIPTEIALEVARRINGIMAPTIIYRYKAIQRNGGGNHFSVTRGLDGNTAICLVSDILRKLARHGARRVLLFNGHFENSYFLWEGADLAIRDPAAIHIDKFEVIALTCWNFIVGDTLL